MQDNSFACCVMNVCCLIHVATFLLRQLAYTKTSSLYGRLINNVENLMPNSQKGFFCQKSVTQLYYCSQAGHCVWFFKTCNSFLYIIFWWGQIRCILYGKNSYWQTNSDQLLSVNSTGILNKFFFRCSFVLNER